MHLLPDVPVRPRPSGLVAAAQPWSFTNSDRTDHVGSIAALPVGMSNSSAFNILMYAPACVRSLVPGSLGDNFPQGRRYRAVLVNQGTTIQSQTGVSGIGHALVDRHSRPCKNKYLVLLNKLNSRTALTRNPPGRACMAASISLAKTWNGKLGMASCCRSRAPRAIAPFCC